MVARSASAASAFVPGERPRVAVANDGTLAAIIEPSRIVVIDLPACSERAEIGIDPEAGASDVVWVGTRLAVLSRYAAHSTVHLVDPAGPRTLAEIRLEAPMKLVAAVGTHALAVGSVGAAVIAAGESHLTPYQFPSRTVPVTAGAAGTQFVVALAGTIEEWDPQSRMPKRRIKLARPTVITAVGGSERVVWMTTQADPTRLDVFTFVNRGQPKGHDLPEPIAHVASHPKSDLVVCLGADTRKLYAIDLDGKQPMRTLAVDGIDRADGSALIVGRMLGVLAAQARRPVSIVVLEGQGDPAAPAPIAPAPIEEPAKTSTLFGDESEPPPPATPVEPAVPVAEPAKPSVLGPDPRRKPSLHRVAKLATAAKPATTPAPPPVQPPISHSLAAKVAAWRERTRAQPTASASSTALGWLDARPSWRDAIHAWTRAVIAGIDHPGARASSEPPAMPLGELVLARFELPPQLLPAVALLYGAHLAGEPGAAPVDVARVIGRRWDEALGRGRLVASGVASVRDSRVRLAPAVQRVLDELPATTGALVGTPSDAVSALYGPCVVVAPTGTLGIVAQTCLPLVGSAILAADDASPPADVIFEARAYGAVPMLRVLADGVTTPLIVVVLDDAAADATGLPQLS